MNMRPKTFGEAFSYTTAVAGKHWNPAEHTPPFRVMSAINPPDAVGDLLRRQADAESKAEPLLPFPLDRLPDQLADAYLRLSEARQTMLTGARTAVLSPEEKKLLRLDARLVEKLLRTIKELSVDIEKLRF